MKVEKQIIEQFKKMVMNIMKDSEQVTSRIPKGADKIYIKNTLKSEFGEEVVYNKTENTIFVLNNLHLSNPVLVKILAEFKLYLQTSLF